MVLKLVCRDFLVDGRHRYAALQQLAADLEAGFTSSRVPAAILFSTTLAAFTWRATIFQISTANRITGLVLTDRRSVKHSRSILSYASISEKEFGIKIAAGWIVDIGRVLQSLDFKSRWNFRSCKSYARIAKTFVYSPNCCFSSPKKSAMSIVSPIWSKKHQLHCTSRARELL